MFKTVVILVLLCSLSLHLLRAADLLENEFNLKNKSTLISEDIAALFFKSHQIKTPKISPNGKFISFIRDEGSLSKLILLNTTTNKRNLLMEDKFDNSVDIIDFYWIDDRSIILDTHIKGKGSVLLWIKLTFKKSKLSSFYTKILLNDFFMVNPLPNLKNIIVIGKWNEGKTALYKIDISKKALTGQLRHKYRLNNRSPNATKWLTNFYGKITLGYGLDERDNLKKVWLKNRRGKKWNVVWKGEESVTFIPVLVDRERKTLIVISNEKSDFNSLYEYDFSENKYLRKLYGNDNYDITKAIISKDKKTVLGVSFIQDGLLNKIYFDNKESVVDDLLKDAFDDTTPYIIDYNLDKSVAIVRTSNSIDPGTFHILKLNSMDLIKFETKAPWINQFKLRRSQIIISESTDGQKIESYLTLPSSLKKEKPPLIVLPHGGPISVRDTRHFNSHVQLLATLGYAVLQPNYRGSSGYGKKFTEQGMKQWGRLIEDDIESGLNAVIQKKLVDPDKVCIYGISYGGYSALISSINRPEVFKCAASYAGVTDLTLLFNNVELSESSRKNNLLKKILGEPSEDMDRLIELSPVYQSKKINMPIFLAQGDKDSVVDVEHYYRMKKMLDLYEKNYKHLMLKEEGHGFRYLKNIVLFYVELDSFFRESLELK